MKTLKFTDKYGNKRIGVHKQCKTCGKEFIARKFNKNSNKGVYCSRKCVNKGKEVSQIEVSCSWCNTTFKKHLSRLKNSKSGLYFCTRKCKDEAQKLGGIQEIMPPHYGTATVPDYRGLFSEEELVCSRCGYKEFNCAVDIHHIDHDRSNNNKSNLIPLCSNCHKALHFGKWERNCPKV